MSLKVVVSYASAGNGHRRAAEAIYQGFKADYPEINISCVDILSFTNPAFANLYSRGYSFLVTHLRFVWAIAFKLTSIRSIGPLFHCFCRITCRSFINFLLEQQPDVILVTHFFAAAVAAYLKSQGRINSRLVTVITDFGVHPFWVLKGCDLYIVGLDYTRDCLIRQGINQDRIKVLGIPADSGFSRASKKAKQGFSALLVTGSFGFSLIEKAVGMLCSDVNLIVVCGNNRRLYKTLENKRYTGVRLFGFTKDMPELMSQVDVIITKPGGLTIAEALIMELPLVFIGAIPGQETENAKVLEAYGCAIKAKDLKSLKGIILDFKANPGRLTSMRTSIIKLKNPDAAAKICQYITRYVCPGSI